MKINLLSKINSPVDIKRFSLDELSQLCDEISEAIISAIWEDSAKQVEELSRI